MDRPLTIEEYERALTALRYGSAGGPSQLTPSVIKSWSPAIADFVFDHLNVLWTTRHVPEWMKDKKIRLVPKCPGTTDLNNMRPISLYETLRKIMTTIIARRIHLVWHTSGILNSNQYGYRLQSGTTMPLYNVINHIEAAHTEKETTLITFWDFKRAFDSIPRNLQKLAWVRLGLSVSDAEWFVELDDNSHSFLITPLFEATAELHSSFSLHRNATHFHKPSDLAFTAQRGIGQGESASSLVWVAIYDILLDWLTPLLTRTSQLNAYADDLATITTGIHALADHQRLAGRISAFCAFTGMSLNYTKIVPVILGPTSIRLTIAALSLYDHNWNCIPCPLQRHPEGLKYLGVTLDHLITNEPHKSLDALIQTATTLVTHLLDQPAPPHIKLDYIRFKIIPILLARAVCGNWSLSNFRKLDKPLTRAYRLLLALPAKFPNALFYLPHQYGGNNLPRLSDLAQTTKWQIMLRCDLRGSTTRNTVRHLLYRLTGTTTDTPSTTIITFCAPTSHKHLLARSLAQWITESQLQITKRTPLPNLFQTRAVPPTPTESAIAEFAHRVSMQFKRPSHPALTSQDIYAICTDGSFRPQRETTSTCFSDTSLHCTGTGAAAIVVIPTNNDPPLALRIAQPRSTRALTPYLWELLAQTVAVHLANLLRIQTTIYSDCKAAIANTSTALSLSATTPTATGAATLLRLTNSIQHAKHVKIRFVRSHPELCPKRTLHPSARDKAIYMADRVADAAISTCTLGTCIMPLHTVQVTSSSVFDDIIPLNFWYLSALGDPATPVLHNYQD